MRPKAWRARRQLSHDAAVSRLSEGQCEGNPRGCRCLGVVWVRYTAHWSINHTGAPVRVACGTNTTHISLRRHPKRQGIPREAYLCLVNPSVTLQSLSGQRLPGKKRLHLLIGVKIHFYNKDNKLIIKKIPNVPLNLIRLSIINSALLVATNVFGHLSHP